MELPTHFGGLDPAEGHRPSSVEMLQVFCRGKSAKVPCLNGYLEGVQKFNSVSGQWLMHFCPSFDWQPRTQQIQCMNEHELESGVGGGERLRVQCQNAVYLSMPLLQPVNSVLKLGKWFTGKMIYWEDNIFGFQPLSSHLPHWKEEASILSHK